MGTDEILKKAVNIDINKSLSKREIQDLKYIVDRLEVKINTETILKEVASIDLTRPLTTKDKDILNFLVDMLESKNSSLKASISL